MITVSCGDWQKPIYSYENKDAHYLSLIKPIEPTYTTQRKEDLTVEGMPKHMGIVRMMSVASFVQGVMRSGFQKTPGALRTTWIACLGYIQNDYLSDCRVSAVAGTFCVEVASNPTELEVLRQEIMQQITTADNYYDGPIRADSRRSMINYLNVRSKCRVEGLGNNPTVEFERDGLQTLAAGGNWVGVSFELCTVVFPELIPQYQRIHMLDKVAAITNAISSLPRDQREHSGNALIPVYSKSSRELSIDLARVSHFIQHCSGPELSMVGHFVAMTNIHSRYILLAVFLAAAGLGGFIVANNDTLALWRDRATSVSTRMRVPALCATFPPDICEPKIEQAILHLGEQIRIAEGQGTKESFAIAQLALHRFIDEEAQAIFLRKADPRVLWAVCSSMFWTLIEMEGIAGLLLQGNCFKALNVETEHVQQVWLEDMFKAL